MQKKIDPKTLKKAVLFALLETAISIILVAADLISKKYAFQTISSDITTMGGFLIFTTVKNTGASFGIFGGSTLALGLVSLVCSIFVYGFTIYTEQTRTPLLRAALVLILAGAVGNMVDRFALGYVRDFIKFSIFPWVFNLADSFLTVGVVLLIIYVIFFYTRDKERADKKKASKPTAEGLLQAESEGEEAEVSDASSEETKTIACEKCAPAGAESANCEKNISGAEDIPCAESAPSGLMAEEKTEKEGAIAPLKKEKSPKKPAQKPVAATKDKSGEQGKKSE